MESGQNESGVSPANVANDVVANGDNCFFLIFTAPKATGGDLGTGSGSCLSKNWNIPHVLCILNPWAMTHWPELKDEDHDTAECNLYPWR